jgi:polysaccharide deacetylase 2 family uncharacterized protein YibQ
MTDDLDRPLGQDRKPPPKKAGGLRWISAGAVVAVLGGGAVLLARSGGRGGEPEAQATIQPLAPKPAPAPPQAPPPGAPQAAPQGQNVEIENGVRVIRGGGGPSSVIIQVPEIFPSPLHAAPDRRLVEQSAFGLLPRRGKDGAAPAEVYARPLSMQPAFKPGAPRIALLVGGMGLNAAATEDAISRLPGTVSLAFAPYGEDVERLAARAREGGHEILLQSPMESFDPGDKPGPHMLQTGDPLRLADDLHWQMARFVGYVGLVNYLGGRLTADRGATQALFRELNERGLAFLDDGSSPQSLAGEAAAEKGVAFVKADLRIDESRRPEAIDAALAKLETLAREKGLAVGFAAGLPGSVERIARFAAELSRRGVVLVPVSAALRAPADGKR